MIFQSLYKLLKLHSPSYAKVTARKSTGSSSKEIKSPNATLTCETTFFNNRKFAIKFGNGFRAKKFVFHLQKSGNCICSS